ncbi:NUDIX hydrolase [Jiella marina]|uniref:NUDIX hydrolase n=1 Tax=Jiella sp. LLJ827 TaxID=2917712 RepID=UPI002100B8C3|nr:NUDIX domain-containing protein [Jiella sp. LLJ827]MCQ0987289.1 NUDIX domain-containing protein [Jiella sp. LLJ827]
MTIWRPPQRIRVLVIGLVWRGGHLLAAEVLADSGELKGFRPLGGGVEFGERREEALIREFREELGCAIHIAGPWMMFENIFRHEGHVGHEMVFAADTRIDDPTLYEREEIDFSEEDGPPLRARWVDPFACPAGLPLYPPGLAGELAKLR